MDQESQIQEHTSAPGLIGAPRSLKYLRSQRFQPCKDDKQISSTHHDLSEVHPVQTLKTSPGEHDEGQNDLLIEGLENEMTSPFNPQESTRLRNEHATQFYGPFLSSSKSYVGSGPCQRIRHGRLPDIPASGSRNGHQHRRQNKVRYSYAQRARQSPNVRGTAHSDKHASEGKMAWEDYKSQQEERKENARIAVSNAIAKENELLILGDTILEKESDLIDLSDTTDSAASPMTSACTSPAALEAYSPPPPAMPQNTSTLVSPISSPIVSPAEDNFGDMVLQDLRALKPFVRASTTINRNPIVRIDQQLNQPECLQEAPLSPITVHLVANNDLIELDKPGILQDSQSSTAPLAADDDLIEL